MRYLKSFNESLKTIKSDLIKTKIANYFNKLSYKDVNGVYGDQEKNKYGYHYSIQSQNDFVKKEEDKIDIVDLSISWKPNNPKILKDIMHIIESSGYFISSATGNDGYDDGEFINDVEVSPKSDYPTFPGRQVVSDKNKIYDTLKNLKKVLLFIEPIYDEVKEFDGNYLYHTTPKKYLSKILKIGLVPKSKNKVSFYPDRIYLSPDLEWNNHIKKQLEKDGDEYITLKIKYDGNIKLYKDLRFSSWKKSGFFTYDNISPNKIEIIK